jgi:hypothetical protein
MVEFDSFFYMTFDRLNELINENDLLTKEITLEDGTQLLFVINKLHNYKKPAFFFRSLLYKKSDNAYILVRYTPNNVKYVDTLPNYTYATDYWHGTLITIMYIGNEWKFLLNTSDAENSKHRNNELDYADLILDTTSIDELCKHMNKDFIYYFTLIHHQDNFDKKTDYSGKYGPTYKKLIFLESRTCSQDTIRDSKFESAIEYNLIPNVEKLRYYSKKNVDKHPDKQNLLYVKRIGYVSLLYKLKN